MDLNKQTSVNILVEGSNNNQIKDPIQTNSINLNDHGIQGSTLITQSVGYKAELAKYGLTEELITSALVEDIEKKPQKRVRELELGADILSMRKRPIETQNTINIALFSTEQQERIAQRIMESLSNKPQNT